MVDINTIGKLVEELSEQPQDTNKTYTAVVSRKDTNGIIWVYLSGATQETPTASTSADVESGDTVTVEWRSNKLYIVGNSSNPSAGVIRVQAVEHATEVASQAAANAVQSAGMANEAASNAVQSASAASEAASSAVQSATAAGQAATAAQASADNANEYAARALGNLSTVQSVTETLNWITSHGTMTLTSDTAPDPTHVYFVRDANGDYEVGSYHYSVVTEPKTDEMSTYYELSIDESLNNYVGTHLAVTSEGLWLLPDSGGNKVLIATGSGSIYTTAGTYIIDRLGNVVAKFTADGIVIGEKGSSKQNMVIKNDQVAVYKNDTPQVAVGGAMAFKAGGELLKENLTVVFDLMFLPQSYPVRDEGLITYRTTYSSLYFNGLTLPWALLDRGGAEITSGTWTLNNALTESTLFTVLDNDYEADYRDATYFVISDIFESLENYYSAYGIEISYSNEDYYDYNTLTMRLPATGQDEEQLYCTFDIDGVFHGDMFHVTWDGDVVANGEVIDGGGHTLSKKVSDVKVNGNSVVTNGVANVSVPTATSDLTNDSGFIDGSSLAAVATSGDYSDLTGTPTLSPMFKTVTVTASSATSIAANSYKNIALAPANQSGYTRVGLIGWNTGSTHVFIATCTGTTITFCNKSSSAQSVTPSAVWLFIRSTF